MIAKTALVAGSDTPIGDVFVHALRARGFAVACVAQKPGSVADGCIAGDLSRPADAQEIIDAAIKSLGGPIGVLINASAQGSAEDRATLLTPEMLTRDAATNAHMPILLTQAFAAQVPETAQDSLVVNVLSGDTLSLISERTSFVLAQSALSAYTKIAAKTFAPHTRVNALVPPSGSQAPGSVSESIAQDVERALGLLLDVKTVTGETLVVDAAKTDAWRTPDHL